MQVTALLVAVLLIGTAVAQTSVPTNTPWPARYDVTMKNCLGASCDQACNGETFPGGVCHTSRRNSSVSEALFCNQAGICLNLQLYMGQNCNGPTFEIHRISNQCDGDDRMGWSIHNYLGNNKMQVNLNCSSDCVTGCEVSDVVDITTCWNIGRISGTLDYFGGCRWINADRFVGACSHSSPLLSRMSIEEGVCFQENNGLQSTTFQCEGAPRPPAVARTKVNHNGPKHTKKVTTEGYT